MKKFWNKSSKIIILGVITAGIFVSGHFVFAQTGSDITGLKIVENAIGLQNTNPIIVIANVIRVFLGLMGIVFLLLVIYAGYLWMTSGGDSAKINEAKAYLRNAAIGLVIMLASFGIVTFIIDAFLSGTGVGGGGNEATNAGTYNSSLGALGNGIISSVYPEPNQTDVPRNTGIIVTFREPMDPTTICQTSGTTCTGQNIVVENFRLFKTSTGDSCHSILGVVTGCNTSNITGVAVYSNDNRTFTFSPATYLGSPTENIWHSIILSTALRKADGSPAFQAFSNGFSWQFEVSSKLDLTPPQVVSGGVFPAPDNQKDLAGSSTPAVAATGHITVNAQPVVYTPTSVGTPVPVGSTGPATISGTYNCSADGTISVSITAAMTVSVSGVPGLAPGAGVSGGTAPLGCGLTLVPASGSFTAGNAWNFTVIHEKQADSLTIGSSNYTFVSSAPTSNQILRGGTIAQTVANIVSALGGNASVNAAAAGSAVNLTAKVAGTAGNNIALSTNNTATFAITSMSGGSNLVQSVAILDMKDKPMNAVIQINFNEAMNPLTLSGDSGAVQNYIRVVNLSAGGAVLAGKFMISNQYKTVEFVSNTQCGVNACGEAVYCLPANSQLRVDIIAAGLYGCTGGADCASKTPFTTCGGSLCQDTTSSTSPINFPGATLPLNGVADASFNSLDGNRNANAQGPASFYNENSPSANGDNYQWSFYISDVLDLTPPTILTTDAANGAANVDVYQPVSISFDKVMMSSSLATGAVTVTNGTQSTVHQLINLKTFTNQPVGYWISNVGVDVAPADGEPESTIAFIDHSDFAGTTAYKAQVGSGVRDIYQNCYKPAVGPACFGSVSPAIPSCCSGTPTAAANCP